MDVRVLKTADHLHDGIDFANMAEKLVAETFSLACALHQAGDIDEFDSSRNDLLGFREPASFSRRSSGTLTMPRFGSMVQKGKFAAWAFRVRVTALKRVDLPTLGSPTIPALSIRRGKLPNPGKRQVRGMWRRLREMCDIRMMRLEEIVNYQNDLLRISEFEDYPNARNGLQLQNSGTVTRLPWRSMLANRPSRWPSRQGADLLIVHHGLLWGGLQSLTGPTIAS